MKFQYVLMTATLVDLGLTQTTDRMVKDGITPIAPMAEYVAPPDPGRGRYYPDNFRILNCWECF